MEYAVDREKYAPDEPSLVNMTEIAIRKLSMNPNGYYLFVEGGHIDKGHHANRPIKALYDFKLRVSLYNNEIGIMPHLNN